MSTTPTAATKQIFINAAKLDAKTPIPLETNGNGYITKKGRRYVPFFDNGDNFFQVILEANLLSPTNLSCINSKTKFSIGKGWHLVEGQEDLQLNEWAKSVNKKGQSLNDIIKAVFNNKYGAGNCFIEIVKIKIGSSKYVKVYVRNFVDCRLSMPGDDDIPESVIVSKQFRRRGVWTMGTNDYVEIPLWNGQPDQKWLIDDNGNQHVMIHLKNDIAGYDYYGMPSNVASLPQQILEYKMSRYNLDSFDNNLVIGGIVLLQGNMTADEAKKLSVEATKAHSGDGNRGKYVFFSSENGVENSKVIPFEQNKEYDYINGSRRVEEQILMANEWSKVLIDPQSGSMGNSGKQIRELYETKMNTVVAPEQTFVIEKFVQPLMGICDAWMGTKWKDLQFGIKNIPVLGIANEVDVNSVLSIDEGRAALGYSEVEDGTGKNRIKAPSKQLNLFDNVPN
jgi:Phage portal protein